MHLQSNTLLHGGTYRIIRFISSGGFGCTYEAEHVMLQKRVAIKEFYVKDYCNRDETTAHITVGTVSKKGLVDKLRRKFIDEARALCKLRHPGIVSVSDVFEENGTAYFVMDYIDGKSISEIVNNEGSITEKRAVRYIRQVAIALQYVHDNNRLHLDIKPGNIMIDGNDNPVLIDFGASKQYDEEAGENTSTLMCKTPGYAPAEQMSNSVVKFIPATDIYAVGATLYKMLTGITPLDVNLRISGEELEPLPANISAATRNAVAAAMEINKNNRPQSISDFLKLLNNSTVISDNESTVIESECATHSPVINSNITLPNSDESKNFGRKYGIFIIGFCAAMLPFVIYITSQIMYKTSVTKWEQIIEDQGSSEFNDTEIAEDTEIKTILEKPAASQSKKPSNTTTPTISNQHVKPQSQPVINRPEETQSQPVANRSNEPQSQPSTVQQPSQASPKPAAKNIEMVFVAGGTFKMGSDTQNVSSPVHNVTVSSYYIGKYEVTQLQWTEIMGTNPSHFIGEDLPVENITWEEIQEFITKLNARTGKNYRLPTEAEWEFAARGGSSSNNYTYSGSNMLSSVAWYKDNSNGKSHPVGSKSPNELGIYDMSGNVQEWCQDWYGRYPDGSQINPTGVASGSDKVLRGGSWYFAEFCNITARNGNYPHARGIDYGFRLALDAR